MWAATGAAVTIGLGMVLRSTPGVGDALGGIAYTVLVAFLIVALRPATTPLVAGFSAFLFSCGIELVQLSPLPETIVARVPAARWVLGSTFNASDFLWYAVGGAVALGACWMLESRSRP